ncbi:MAG: hypothetical protein OEL78_03245 [Hyphomicrobiales bacterium]|nr:hypothetical protein [Hyphomicrobiales bacterium]
MPSYLVYLFCAAVGFAAAGAITCFYQLVTDQTAEFATEWRGWPAAFVAVLLSMFGGPFILARKVYVGIRLGEMGAMPAIMFVGLCFMWSTCAGVIYIDFALNI